MAATPCVGVLDVHRQGLRLATDAPMDLDDDLPEALKVAAEQLRLRAKTDPEVAGRALHHLYRLVREKPPPLGGTPAGQSMAHSPGIETFLNRPHPLLGGETPLDMARSSSAGTEAVLNLMRRLEASVVV